MAKGVGEIGKTVLTIGVFDLFHRGHLELLRCAASHGERLVVIVNGDAFTAKYKRRPTFNEADRLAIVRSVRFVDEAAISNSADIRPFLEEWSVNAIVHGDDWEHTSYLQQICVSEEYLNKNSIEMIYVPYYSGLSTSMLLEKLSGKK